MKTKLPALVQLAILTLITTLTWVGFEVYRAFTTEAPPSVTNEVLSDFDPTLDVVVLDGLVNKVQLEDSEIGDTVLTNPDTGGEIIEEPAEEIVLELPEETVVEEEVATESAETT